MTIRLARPPRPLRPWLALTLCAAAVALPGAGAEPQPTAPPLVETVEVRVVNVEVTVTDELGDPVSGLERDDFTIYEDGKPQEVTNFYSIERTRVRSSPGEVWREIEADSQFRRRMVLLVDNNTLSKPERAKALDALHDFLDQKFDESYEWSVVAVGDEVQVVQPLTTEKFRVRAAIDRIGKMPTNASRFRIDRMVLNDPMRIRNAQRAGASTPDAPPALHDLSAPLRFESQINMMRNLEATFRTARAMVDAFRAYGNLSGKKVMVVVTGGIEMLPEYGFQGGAGVASIGPASGSQDVPIDDPKLYQLYLQLRETLGGVVREANAANFTIYPIKATGLGVDVPQLDVGYRSSGATISEAAFSGPVEIDDSDTGQVMLADGTGGLYTVYNRLLEAVERVDADSSSFYSLGYTPGHLGDGEFHKIRVEAKNPKWTVRARAGYVDLTEEQRLERMLTSSLAYAKDKGTLPVRLELKGDPSGKIRATAVLPLEQLEFVEQGGQDVGRVRVYLAIFTEDGQPIDLIRREQDLSFPSPRRAEALAEDLRYELRFELPSRGHYVVTMTLRDEISQEMGTALGEVRL